MTKLNRWSSTGLPLIASIFLSATSVGTSHAQTKITLVTSNTNLNYSALYIAQERGYFKSEGLDVTFSVVAGGPKAVAALIGGSAEFSASAIGDAIAAQHQGRKDIRDIAVLMNDYSSLPFLLRTSIAEKRGITEKSPLKDKVNAIKGLKIAVTTPGSAGDLILRYLVTSFGLKPDRDLEIMPLGTADAVRAAMQTGQVDGCTCTIPLNVTLVKNGIAVPFIDPSVDVPSLKGVHHSVVHSSKAYNDAHPEVTNAFARALVRAFQLMSADPVAARNSVRTYFPQPTIPFDDAWEFAYPMFPKDPALTELGLQKELDVQNAMRPKAEQIKVSFEELADNSFVRRAQQANPR